MEQEKKQWIYIDVLRLLATILVILIHVSSMFISSQGLTATDSGYAIYQWTHCFSSCTVAIFILISGALLLDRPIPISYSRVLTHYLPRILLALAVFGLPMCLMEQYVTNPTSGIVKLIGQSVLNLLTGNCWTHMWYLYMLLGLYLITPVLHVFVCNSSAKEHHYLAAVFVVLGIVFPNLQAWTGTEINYLTLSSWIAIYYLGFYTKRYILDQPSAPWWSVAVLMLYILLCVVQTRLGDMHYGPQYIASVAVAIAMMCICYRWVKQAALAHILSKHCFCIYIVHAVWLNIAYKAIHVERLIDIHPVANILIVATAAFGLSLVTSYVLRLIPWFKNRIL